MSSLNSSSSGSAWRRLLDGKRDDLRKYGIEPSEVVTDETSFRSYFEDLCRTLKNPFGTTLLVKLRFQPIADLANAVETAEQQHNPPLYLAPLIWGCAWVAITTACDAGVNHARIVALLSELNRAIPQVGTHDLRLLHDPSVKTPLYDIVDVYINTLIYIILNIHLAHPSAPIPTAVDQTVEEAVQKIKKEREAYKQSLERVKAHHQQFASDSSSSYARYGGNDSKPEFDLEVLEFLGRGSEGEVHKVRLSGQLMARKQIQIMGCQSAASRTAEQIENEVEIMKKLRHRHISCVLLHDKQPGRHSIFMEPCADMNLNTYLHSCTDFGYTEQALQPLIPWFGCLVDALAFAHQCKIAHRDIKPSNILIKDSAVYLTDFGEARDFSQHEASGTANVLVCGTPVYRAPEVSPGIPRGLPADIFSLGCVFSEMLSVLSRRSLKEYQDWRRVPNSDTPLAFRANLKKVREWIAKLEEDSLRETLGSLIKPMIREEPRERPTAQQLWKFLVNTNDNSRMKFYCDLHYH